MPTTNKPTASFNAKLIHALLQLAQHQGISAEKALEGSSIAHSSIDVPGQRHSIDAFEALLTKLIDDTGNTKLPIQAAQATEPRTLGCLGFIMSTANTLQDAYQMLGDYFSLVYEGIHLQITHHHQDCVLQVELDTNTPAVTEFFIACLLNWPRWLTGRTIPAKSVHFDFQGNDEQLHYRQLATHVKFSQNQAQLVFSSQYMSLNCLEANPEMHQLHCQYADSLQLKSAHKQAIIAQTKHQIRQLIHCVQSSDTLAIRREQVAENLNMSLRTFQRKLSELDTSFQSIYDTVRRETCIQLMTQPALNFGQIAYKLGFSNLSAFQKAFRRWMNTSPSLYRKQLQKNSELPQAISEVGNQAWHSKLDNTQLNVQIATRLGNISHFSRQLLSLCALTEQIFHSPTPIEKLAQISGNTIARLSIYLWPAQQQQLISSIDKAESTDTCIEFIPQEVASEINKTISAQHSTELHFRIASYYQTQHSHTLAVKHFDLCNISLLSPAQINSLRKYSERLLDRHTHTLTPALLNKVYTLSIHCYQHINSESSRLKDLQIEQLSLWIKLAYFDAAHQQLINLQKLPLSQQQSVNLSTTAADLLIEINQVDQALRLLHRSAQHHCDLSDLKKDDSQILSSISVQLETFRHARKRLPHTLKHQPLSAQSTNQLKILQKITQTYLQAQQPLQAAGIISDMLKLCQTHPDDYYSAFACAHFAWICCWFSGDIITAKTFSQKSLILASRHSVKHQKSCELILKHKLYHWLKPIKSLIQEDVFGTKSPVNPTDKSLVQSLVIQQQLKLCCGTPLSIIESENLSILEQLNPGSHQSARKAIQDIFNTCQSIRAPKSTANNRAIKYLSSTHAFSELFSAFYRFEYSKWPSMQYWDKQLESEITSEYLATEAVFICTIMRLQCLEDCTEKKRHSTQESRFDAQITRFKIWQTLSCENFSAQYQITYAIFLSVFSTKQTAIAQFESAFESLERFGHLHHKIVYYHYYSIILATKNPALSLLCKEKKRTLHNKWTT